MGQGLEGQKYLTFEPGTVNRILPYFKDAEGF